jgi:hypothetical protein
MKNNLIAFLFLLCAGSISAQKMDLKKISFYGGLNFSSFIFNEPQDAIKNQLNYKSGSSLGLNFDFETNRHMLRPELLYRKVGSYSDVNNSNLNWTLNYLDVNLAYMYKVLDGEKFDIAPGISYGMGYMIQGEQYIGQQRFDITDGFLKRFDLTGNLMLNFSFLLTKNLSLFGEYRFGMSILNIEKDANQSTRNIFHTLGLGLSMNMASE